MAKILGIGNAVMDHVVWMDAYPKENSESRPIGKTHLHETEQQRRGQTLSSSAIQSLYL